MWFSIFISILQNEKKYRKIVFPKLVPSVYFQKGLNPQIVENKEIHRNLYKNRRMKLLWVLGFHVVSFIDHKIIWIHKVQYS